MPTRLLDAPIMQTCWTSCTVKISPAFSPTFSPSVKTAHNVTNSLKTTAPPSVVFTISILVPTVTFRSRHRAYSHIEPLQTRSVRPLTLFHFLTTLDPYQIRSCRLIYDCIDFWQLHSHFLSFILNSLLHLIFYPRVPRAHHMFPFILTHPVCHDRTTKVIKLPENTEPFHSGDWDRGIAFLFPVHSSIFLVSFPFSFDTDLSISDLIDQLFNHDQSTRISHQWRIYIRTPQASSNATVSVPLTVRLGADRVLQDPTRIHEPHKFNN